MKEKKKNNCVGCAILRRELKKVLAENKELKTELEEMRAKFYGRRRKKKKADETPKAEPKKKGAPAGHPGWSRPKPNHIDETQEVVAPKCHCCGSDDLEETTLPADEHIQEDIVRPKRKVVKFIKKIFKCRKCKALVRGVGKGEMPGCPIGPEAKAWANELRYEIGIPQNKIKRIFEELLDMPFVQSSVVGFEQQLCKRSEDLYEQIKQEMIHAPSRYIDETGWRDRWLWCLCTKKVVFFHIDPSRGGKVLRAIIGKKFKGIVLSDFLAVYGTVNGKKQKCLVHVIRQTVKFNLLYGQDQEVEMFCAEWKSLLKRIMGLFEKRKSIKDYLLQRADIVAQCKRFLEQPLSYEKVEKWRQKLFKHKDELTTCLFHPCSDSNNNFVERMLRPSVIMRKVTFGNRSDKGIHNHQVIMSLLQTVKLNHYKPSKIFYFLLTDPAKLTLHDLTNGCCRSP